MTDRGTLSKARRIKRDLEKLVVLIEDGSFVGVNDRSVEALRNDLRRSLMCANNVLDELGEPNVYG